MKRWISILLCLLIFMASVFTGCDKTRAANVEGYLQDVSDISVPAGTKIVGMGEATHGNKEFVQLKQEVFKSLVKNHEFKTFALEGDFGGCQIVNEFVLNATGTAAEAAKAIGFAVYKTEEMVDFLRWIREYNETASDSDKIRFYGFDMQRYDNNKKGLLSFIEKVDNSKTSSYKELLSDLNDETVFDQKKEKVKKGLEAINTIINEMEHSKEQYIAKSSMEEYNLASQYALCIKQNATLRGTNVNYSETRDKYMAEKVQWILDYEKGFGRENIFLSGHNGHIEKTSASPAGYTSMGERLSKAFKNEYFAIGTDFYNNSFLCKEASSGERKTFKLKNDKSDLIRLFEKSNKKTGLLDIKSALNDSNLSKILLSKQKMGNVGDEFNAITKMLSFTYTINMVPADAYDTIIFVRDATPVTTLD